MSVSSSSIYDSAILIIGPGMDKEPVMSFLAKKIPNLFVIGDGDSSIIINENNEGEYRDGLLKIKGLEEFTSPTSRTLVVVDAHGNIDYEGDHIIRIGGNKTQSIIKKTQYLFKNIAVYLNKSTDIIFTACHGGAALKDIDILPTGSRIAILSQENESTYTPNSLKLFATNLFDEISFSLEAFYEHYLFHMISQEHPIFAEVGGKIINSSEFYASIPLNAAEESYVKDKLVKLCNQDDKCITRVNDVLDNFISNDLTATSSKNNASYYPALVHTLFAFKNYTEEYTASDKCLVQWYTIKDELNKIFEQHSIPLSVNLEKLLIEEGIKEEVYLLIHFLTYYEKQGNAIMYDTLDLIGDPNDNFPAPEQPNHGVELLIGMYVEEYRSSFADIAFCFSIH